MEHFLVFPVFWDNMNLAGHTLKAEKTILDRYFQIHTENCCVRSHLEYDLVGVHAKAPAANRADVGIM